MGGSSLFLALKKPLLSGYLIVDVLVYKSYPRNIKLGFSAT